MNFSAVILKLFYATKQLKWKFLPPRPHTHTLGMNPGHRVQSPPGIPGRPPAPHRDALLAQKKQVIPSDPGFNPWKRCSAGNSDTITPRKTCPREADWEENTPCCSPGRAAPAAADRLCPPRLLLLKAPYIALPRKPLYLPTGDIWLPARLP